MILGVSGTRYPSISYNEFTSLLKEELINLSKVGSSEIEFCSGGAIGIDTYIRNYAIECKIPIKEFLPDYNKYGKPAPMIRNQQIVDYSDLVIAFPSKNSRGTRDTIRKAERIGKLYKIIEI